MENDPLKEIEKIFDDMESLQEELEQRYHGESESWWNSLSKEEQLAAFYSVTKRIHHGFLQQTSYRGILYGIFGFDSKAYSVGIASGFFEMYNHTDVLSPKDNNIDGA